MTDTRRVITDALRRKGWTMAQLSRELGRNHAYIQQFVTRHSPQDLEYRDKVKAAKLLNLPLTELGIDLDTAAPAPTGLAEETEAWEPPKGGYVNPAPGLEYFRARTDALDRHPLQVKTGDIVVVDISAGVLERIQSLDAVIVQCYSRSSPTAVTCMRQFIAPALLITNSSGANTAWRMDDDTLPFEPVIKGRIVSVLRTAN